MRGVLTITALRITAIGTKPEVQDRSRDHFFVLDQSNGHMCRVVSSWLFSLLVGDY
jgi:hypothetical protein